MLACSRLTLDLSRCGTFSQGGSKGDFSPFCREYNRPYSRCQLLKPSLVFLNRASYGGRWNNDVTSQEREVTMMLRHNLRTDAQICGKSATQASLFVRHGRGVNRLYSSSFCTTRCLGNKVSSPFVRRYAIAPNYRSHGFDCSTCNCINGAGGTISPCKLYSMCYVFALVEAM